MLLLVVPTGCPQPSGKQQQALNNNCLPRLCHHASCQKHADSFAAGHSEALTHIIRTCSFTEHHKVGRGWTPLSSSDAMATTNAWNLSDWSHMVFSDESQFYLGLDNWRIHVWRRHGQCYSPGVIMEQHTSITPGFTIRGAIAYDTQSRLVILHRTLMDRHYVNNIL